MFIELTILLLTIAIVADYLIKKGRNDLTVNIPGLKSFPLIGSGLELINRTPKNLLDAGLINRKKYGSMYKAWLFNTLFVFCSDPKDLEIILSSTKYINKGYLYNLLKIWLGDGLLISSGAKWHTRRKIITPTFHFKILEQFVEIFDRNSEILVQKLKSKANGEGINIQPDICLEALDIIAETAMGTKINAQTNPQNEYAAAVTEIAEIMAERFVDLFLRFEWIFKIFASEKKQRQSKALKILHSYTEDVIEKRRQALEESIGNGTYKPFGDDDIGSKKKMAFLDVLLQANVNGKPLTNEDIREEVDTFMFEGHDTTTSAICSALLCISIDKDIQEKLFEEIKVILGEDKSRSISLKELQDLKYLDCVIKETLRLYPSVPIIGRLLGETITLNGKTIPAGTNISINFYAMQRDDIMFPDPDKFNPDRFLVNNVDEKINSFGYIPFSAGPRNCIGQKFAMFEMKSTISKILRHYELLPMKHEMDLAMNLILKSKNGVVIGLKPRVY